MHFSKNFSVSLCCCNKYTINKNKQGGQRLKKSGDWGGGSPSSMKTHDNEVMVFKACSSVRMAYSKSRPEFNWESLARCEKWCLQMLSIQSDSAEETLQRKIDKDLKTPLCWFIIFSIWRHKTPSQSSLKISVWLLKAGYCLQNFLIWSPWWKILIKAEGCNSF